MNELIKIEERNGIETVSARELYDFMEVKSEFKNWIKNRIDKYKFIEHKDYEKVGKILPGSNGQIANEYYISMDMAKEISMVENNEKGREARQYFIDCEKKLKDKQLENKTDQRLDRLENMMINLMELMTKQMTNNIKPTLPESNYYTIIGYVRIKLDSHIPTKIETQTYGKICSRVSRERNIPIKKVYDERYGEVGSYRIDILDEVMEDYVEYHKTLFN